MTSLHEKKDLTRWNRAGLERFRYVDGNAVTYLETLRLAMREAFSDSLGNNLWDELDSRIPVPASETGIEANDRWLKQYRDERRDHAWELLRTLARSAHVLTEHLDAYANEHFLTTATEWENIRRLVAMLDYHPAPPASATTSLAIIAKAPGNGTDMKLVLERGFAVKNKPPDGGKPSVFETLDDLELDLGLNNIKPLDWNRSQLDFSIDAGTNSCTFPLQQALQDVSVGGRGVLLLAHTDGTTQGIAVSVSDLSATSLQLNTENIGSNITVKRYQVSLLLQPSLQRDPQLSGSDVALVSADHGISAGTHLAWVQSGSWTIARVLQVEVNRVRLSRSAPAAGTDLYATAFSDRESYDLGGSTVQRIILPTHKNDERIYGADWDENLNDIGGHYHATESGSYLYDYIDGTSYNRIYYVPDVDPVASVEQANPVGISFDGKLKDLNTGDWLQVSTASADLQAVQITSKSEHSGGTDLVTSPPVTGLSRIYGVFEQQLDPLDHDRNQLPVFLTQSSFRSDKYSTLPLALSAFPDLLRPGRKLIISGLKDAMLVTVAGVDAANQRITVQPPIPGSEPLASGSNDNYSRYGTRIYGNVSLAGHGESQSEKVLGSGDATRSQQTFLFEQHEIAYVSDGAFPPGVRADIDIRVDGRSWQQVSRLHESAAEDHHYTVRLTEDGDLSIRFGDGVHGRRLPSGNNNVRIRYRKGTGLTGNLAPGSLQKEVKPHYLVDSFVQPILSSGGNDLEDTDSMRDNAPASVLTLERAVSLADFIHLAAGNSSVWQAAAVQQNPALGRSQKIDMAVVPAGGGALGLLAEQLRDYLVQHALPDVAISVMPYEAVIFSVTVTIRVDEAAFDANIVSADVIEQLKSWFALANRKLGAPLYRSQLFAAVEAVTGVENCQCDIDSSGFRDESGAVILAKQVITGSSGAIRRVTPNWNQVIYLHDSLSTITVNSLSAASSL